MDVASEAHEADLVRCAQGPPRTEPGDMDGVPKRLLP
jgi:hypothetical protein